MDDEALPLMDWPLTLGAHLDEASAIHHLISDALEEWTHPDRIEPREAGDLIDLIRDGARRLVETTATLEAIAAWNPQPGLVVLPNPATIRERVRARLQPEGWHTTLDPLASLVIGRESLQGDQATTLRDAAERMVTDLSAATEALDAAVRGRRDAPATRTAEHFLQTFLAMEQAERPAPAPLAPVGPWPAGWWTIAAGGPASQAAIHDDAQRQQAALALSMRQLARSRSITVRTDTAAAMLALGAAGIDAIRRLRLLQHVVVFVIDRTLNEWPIITPVPTADGLPWAIGGDRLPLLEEQRAGLMAAPPAKDALVAFLRHVADDLAEMQLDTQAVEAMERGNDVEGLGDVDAALARLVHGAAAPPRPAMPWLDAVAQARATRRELRAQAIQVRDAILSGRIARPKRRRGGFYDRHEPTIEGQACIDAIREAVEIDHPLTFRAAVLGQMAQLVAAGERPTPEDLRSRWVARVWWTWNDRAADWVFRDAIHEASVPLNVLVFNGAGELRCGLAGVYERMAEVLSDSIRDASRAEDALWALGVDPRPWAHAAQCVYAEVDAANPHPKATVCCDCGTPLEGVLESHQCRRCEQREWRV